MTNQQRVGKYCRLARRLKAEGIQAESRSCSFGLSGLSWYLLTQTNRINQKDQMTRQTCLQPEHLSSYSGETKKGRQILPTYQEQKQREINKMCAIGGTRRLKTEGWGSVTYRSFGILTGITCLPCLR